MASLRQIVQSPTLAGRLSYLSRPRADPPVERLALIEDVADLEHVGERAMVLLTHGASAAASTYRFDMALRLARSRGVAALVLSAGDVGGITPTSAAIADRSGTAILGTPSDVDLAELAVDVSRELAGGADVALLRTHAALRAIEVHPADGRPEALVERAGAALGVPLSMVGAQPAAGPRAAVVVDGRVEAWLTAPPQDGDLAMGLDIVLHVAAAGAGQALTSVRHAEELPIQSREEVLTELFAAPARGRPDLVQRARTLGLPIDRWHVAVRVEFEELVDPSADEDMNAYRGRQDLARALLQALRAAEGEWHGARSGVALLLVRMFPADPGPGASGAVAKTVERALAGVRSRLPSTLIRCGVGSAHAGPAGLLASAAEAKAAATGARASGRVNAAVPFDSVGLRRTLVEWYASDTAQEAVTTVLAPLTRLGGARAERLIQTLHVYLDQRGSLTKTAETLSLHRNAVAYRMNQIFELLDVDQDNADDLLLLQLACRARELV